MKKSVIVLFLAATLLLTSFTGAMAGPAMDRILKSGEIRIGTTGTQPPLSVTSKTGEIIGLDADIARALATGMKVKASFVQLPFSDLIGALKDGRIDMIISSMTMTPTRNTSVAFVGPYYISGKGILTKDTTVAALKEPAGLDRADFKVAALRGSTSKTFVEMAAPKASLVTTVSYDDAVQLLLNDQVNAMIADLPFCAFTAFRNQGKGLVAGQARFTFEPLGIALPEDALLINYVQNTMGLLQGSGQLRLLQEKWLKDGSWIKDLPE